MVIEKICVQYDAEFAGRLYGSYLKSNRKRLGITAKQIAKGLCSGSEISEIENGRKNAGWLCRERLLLRAGVTRDAHESYLNCEDHAEWKIQKEILSALGRHDAARMMVLLRKYADSYGIESWEKTGKEQKTEEEHSIKKKQKVKVREKAEDKEETGGNVIERLRRQFYLGMKGMCRKLCAAPMEELVEIFGEAVCLTMPTIEEGSMYGLALCPEEINLMLEYAQCLPFYEAFRWCKEIEKYLRNARIDDWVKVLNYPKVILILCRMLPRQEKEEEEFKKYVKIIKLCDWGIVLLRKTQKAYYLRELLEIKKQAIRWIQEWNCRNGKAQTADSLEGMYTEADEWQKCFDGLYERFCVPKEQNSDIWLYLRQDMYCIGDVIRIRRKMLGMSQKELYEGICSQDTLRRLEHGRASTQPAIVWELCRRLGLSPECERTELVTANPVARELEREIRYAANEGKFEENLVQIEKLKKQIDMSDKINQQWVLRTEGMAKYRLGQIDREEYGRWIRRALECTLPWSVLELTEREECYLTNSEMECIYHYSLLLLPEGSKEAYEQMGIVFQVEQEFEESEDAWNHIRTYELYMRYKAKNLYGFKEYERSLQYTKKIIELCLQIGRVNILGGTLYEWMRSNIKLQKKVAEPTQEVYDWEKDLERCLFLSQFCKNTLEERFYKEVLESISD